MRRATTFAIGVLVLCAVAICSMVTGTLLAFFRPDVSAKISQRTLTFAERVAYQRAIEEVYWRHRIWPKERPNPKPSLDAVMSQAQLEKKVTDYLRNSQALEDYWKQPIRAEQLQAEMDRMAERAKQPEVLRELFEALGSDPLVIAECLARPVLAERLVTNWRAYDERIQRELKRAETDLQVRNVGVARGKGPLESWLTIVDNHTLNLLPVPHSNYEKASRPGASRAEWLGVSMLRAKPGAAGRKAV
jgi:hypothetical protein